MQFSLGEVLILAFPDRLKAMQWDSPAQSCSSWFSSLDNFTRSWSLLGFHVDFTCFDTKNQRKWMLSKLILPDVICCLPTTVWIPNETSQVFVGTTCPTSLCGFPFPNKQIGFTNNLYDGISSANKISHFNGKPSIVSSSP